MQGLYEYGDILKKPVDVFRLGSGPEKKLEFGNHWHYYAEFLLWKSGKGTISCGNETLNMNPGKLVIIPPLMLHSIIMPEGTGTVVTGIKVNLAWIDLYGDYIPRLDRFFLALKNKVKYADDLIFAEKDFPGTDLNALFEGILYEMDSMDYGYDAMVNSHLQEFMVKLIRAMRQRGTAPVPEDIVTDPGYSLGDIAVYIDTHSADNLKVNELASMCSMSYSYFASSFKLMFGMPCKDYITMIRLRKAEKLLRFTNRDLASISHETGFSDSSHLIKCFRKKYGVTPYKYRYANPVS